jgi:hypothetical protein
MKGHVDKSMGIVTLRALPRPRPKDVSDTLTCITPFSSLLLIKLFIMKRQNES